MSLVALKNKSNVLNHSRSRGTKSVNWISRGPFGHSKTLQQNQIVGNGGGFSINGKHRNTSYIGKSSVFSKIGTPYKGALPKGHGGKYGKYKKSSIIFNNSAVKVSLRANQNLNVNPSVLSNKGMLRTKYKWIHSGQYPHHIVQPIGGGNMAYNYSQGLYLSKKTGANTLTMIVNDNDNIYDSYKKCYPSDLYYTNPNLIRSNPHEYVKRTKQPLLANEYVQYLKRNCINQTDEQKPYPPMVQTGTGIIPSGTTITQVGNSCGTQMNRRIDS